MDYKFQKYIEKQESEFLKQKVNGTDLIRISDANNYFNSYKKRLTLYGVVARLLDNYKTDTLLIDMDEENKAITVTKCTLSEDYYADYDYEHLEELTP